MWADEATANWRYFLLLANSFPKTSNEQNHELKLHKSCFKKWKVNWTGMFAYGIATNISLFNVNKNNTRKRCEICSKLTIMTPRYCSLIFFNCCLTNPRQSLDHYRGDNLTNPMLNTASGYLFYPRVTGRLVMRLCP